MKNIVSALSDVVGTVPSPKGTEGLFRVEVNSNPDLQAKVGDPDATYFSVFSQMAPPPDGPNKANYASPLQGDEVFFAYLIPGSVFQSHSGEQWLVEDYSHDGQVQIRNRFYPRIQAQVSFYDIRRSIHSWVEPIQMTVPPIPAGANYDAQPVRVVETV